MIPTSPGSGAGGSSADVQAVRGVSITTLVGKRGDILTSSEQARAYTKEHRDFMYDLYKIRTHYKTDSHKVQLPIARSLASKGPSALIIQLAPPTTKVTVEVEATRTGKWPDLPAKQDITTPTGNHYEVLDVDVSPVAPTLGADGLKNHAPYSIKATYHFATTHAVDGNFDSGRDPAFTKGLFSRYVPASVFNADLFQPKT